MLMESIPGKIEITNRHIFFFADQLQEKKELIHCTLGMLLWAWSI